MITILSRAFEMASNLPENLQAILAQQLLEDIESELQWDQAFENSQEQLAKLADKALREFKAGKTRKMGFDEL